jgi:hypothetical protein
LLISPVPLLFSAHDEKGHSPRNVLQNLLLRKGLIIKGVRVENCEKMARVINCDYSENVGIIEKILILILILKSIPNSCLELKKLFSHTINF